MTSSESRLIELAQQIGAVGMQAAKAYNEAQANLKLEQVLTPERLSTDTGTGESLATLDALSALNSSHKKMFQKFVTAAVAQLTTVLAEVPEERATALRDGMIRSLNWNLDAQAMFYARREEWIVVATSICQLIESRRHSIAFTRDGLEFESDDDLGQFSRLVAQADEIHQLEVAQTAERLARLAKSMAILSPKSA